MTPPFVEELPDTFLEKGPKFEGQNRISHEIEFCPSFSQEDNPSISITNHTKLVRETSHIPLTHPSTPEGAG